MNRAYRWMAMLLTVGLAAGACSSNSDSEVRASAVYEAVMRWFADSAADDPEPLPVFVEPRGEGTSIELAVQAEVIASTADVTDVRFIDAREEALVIDADGVATVRDGGILVRLGPVLEQGRRVTLEVDVFVDGDIERSLRFELASSAERWRVVGEPAEITSG